MPLTLLRPQFLPYPIIPGLVFGADRVQRGARVPGLGRTRSFWQLWHGVSDTLPGSHRRQLERHHEGRASRGLRRRGGLREELLRGRWHCPDVLRHIRADGTVRAGQRGRGCPYETPRGVAQTGNGNDARASWVQTGQSFIIGGPSFQTGRMGHRDLVNLYGFKCQIF